MYRPCEETAVLRDPVCPSLDHRCGADEGGAWTNCGSSAFLKASPIDVSNPFAILHQCWFVRGRRQRHARRLKISRIWLARSLTVVVWIVLVQWGIRT